MIFLFLYAVPYWGSLYFNNKRAEAIAQQGSLFPSPIGVLYISIICFSQLTIGSCCFRPLLGFFIFQFQTFSSMLPWCLERFRPLLGFFIFQYYRHKTRGWNRIVSVPYWGSLYFNNTRLFITGLFNSFPSPTGVLYISMHRHDRKDWGERSFRPLLGFFIFQCNGNHCVMLEFLFPSPTGVLYISIFYVILSKAEVSQGFRPLLGFFIFQFFYSTL